MISVISCKEEILAPPSDLIPESDFVEIMVDLNLIEATRSMHASKEQKLETHPSIFYRQLWEDYDVTEEQFERSFEFYRKDLEHMSTIYERAAEILKRKEDDINAAKKAQKALEPSAQDSLE
jgi:hypothetical protein